MKITNIIHKYITSIHKYYTCYCFDDTVTDRDVYSVDDLLDQKKKYKNISVSDISYKISAGPKPLPNRFDKRDGFIRVLDGEIKYLVLFDYGMFDKICDKIKYLISEKVVLQIASIIILEKLELVHIVLYPRKKYGLFIIL